MQCELIYCLDKILGFNPQWGVDFGNAGTAVVQDMQNLEIFEDGNYDERMTGFNFRTVIPCINEDGDQLEDDDDKQIKLPAKEWATVLITRRFQNRGWIKPYDNEVLADYSNHTAREGSRNRIFSTDDDHTIDADRALILRKVFDEDIAGGDVFSAGTYQRGAA